MRELLLPEKISGKFFLHSMPGLNEPWSEFKEQAKENNVKQVFCLVTEEEIELRSPEYALAIAKNELPFQKTDFPIMDFGVPENSYQFSVCVKNATDLLRADYTILVHCAGGIGRTGMFASCALQNLGLSKEDAVYQVAKIGSGAETKEQRKLVSDFKAQ